MSDGESDKKINTRQINNGMFNVGDFLLPLWLRRIIQENNGLDWVVLGYCRDFLLPFGSILWLIYLFT